MPARNKKAGRGERWQVTNYASLTREYEPAGEEAGPYRVTPSGVVWLKPTRDGETELHLSNFGARIVRDLVFDDAFEKRRWFELEITNLGAPQRVRITAAEFPAMQWPAEVLGSRAVVSAGFGNRDRLREAIQLLSGATSVQTIYGHIGWRQVDGEWLYFHAGGAIGANGVVQGVELQLPPELTRFTLPPPPEGDALAEAVDASLRLLTLRPRSVVLPLDLAIWRALLGPADFTVYLSGPTGVGKTELAALAQQHWGAALNARALPSHWQSTANSLEHLGSLARDAVLVTDDFAPGDSGREVSAHFQAAARVLRAQGNQTGRQRLTRDGQLAVTRPPGCLRIATGEDLPRGGSILARILVLELGPAELDLRNLNDFQRDAEGGLYATALAGYVRWLAGGFSSHRLHFLRRAKQRRLELHEATRHGRIADIQAQLEAAYELFLTFVSESGARGAGECAALKDEAQAVFDELTKRQAAHVAHSEPTTRFLELLREALASGTTHLADRDGSAPPTPGAWGWRRAAGGEWRASGRCVGYLDGEDLFLLPRGAFEAAHELLRADGDNLGVSERQLRSRLADRGLLKSTSEARDTYAVQRTLAGARRTVLHLSAALIGCSPGEQPELTEQDDAAAP